jgi:hypothetical protein
MYSNIQQIVFGPTALGYSSIGSFRELGHLAHFGLLHPGCEPMMGGARGRGFVVAR